MITLALATTFARAAPLSPEAIVGRVEAILGEASAPDGTGIVLDAHLDGERLAALVPLLEERHASLPVLAVENESGLVGAAALASLDRDEGNTAVARAEATMRRASAVGAPYVVLRLGWVAGARRDWTHARDRFLCGALDATLARGLVGARDRVAPGHIDRARSALDRLCRLADSLGIVLLVKNGQRYVELPSPRELDLLRADLQGAPLRPLFDLPAAHLPDVMGLGPLALTEAAFGDGPIVYAGDAAGAIAALPIGLGELGTIAIETLRRQKPEVSRVFRPWPALSDAEIAAGLSSLRR